MDEIADEKDKNMKDKEKDINENIVVEDEITEEKVDNDGAKDNGESTKDLGMDNNETLDGNTIAMFVGNGNNGIVVFGVVDVDRNENDGIALGESGDSAKDSGDGAGNVADDTGNVAGNVAAGRQ